MDTVKNARYAKDGLPTEMRYDSTSYLTQLAQSELNMAELELRVIAWCLQNGLTCHKISDEMVIYDPRADG